MAGIRLRNVKKRYGAFEVIHGVDLDIDDHEFVVFVGPSGCGKSTLLRMIAGLEVTTSGEIFIGDRNVTGMEPVDRNVSMVFQSYALYPHMTVEQNMGFALRANGMDKDEVKRRVGEAAGILHIEEFLDRKPAALSGGQRQRVAIGRAIVRHPDVFLFDEPLSNLDAELRVHMRFEIDRLHKRLDATMVYVTHDQVEAMTLADKIVVLRDGYIEQVGTPLELFDNPDNQFVAGFIGAPKMNFVPAVVEEQGEAGTRLVLPSLGSPALTMPLGDRTLERGQTVTLGIRPEHFAFEPCDGARLELVCELAEQLGDIAYLYSASQDGERLILGLRGDRSKREGDAIEAYIPAERAFLFDGDGGRIR
ncbi:ABC transporter ATP-binding protein [Oricola sp.]|uniref:ABC transporter ATP-binding protein n=1 Tax=Oricola sp. TaxID=1979950 RepID=UPI003BA8B13F